MTLVRLCLFKTFSLGFQSCTYIQTYVHTDIHTLPIILLNGTRIIQFIFILDHKNHFVSLNRRCADTCSTIKRNCGFLYKVFMALMLLMMSICFHFTLLNVPQTCCLLTRLTFTQTDFERERKRDRKTHSLDWHDMNVFYCIFI